MWKTLLPVVGFWFTRERDKAVIDDIPFQLQYIWTTTFLFLSSVLISLTELVGKHVKYIAKFVLLSSFYNHMANILIFLNPLIIFIGSTGKNTGGMHCFDRFSKKRDGNDNFDKFSNFLCWIKGTYMFPEDDPNSLDM